MSQLGQPISGNLNFAPSGSGNPYAGIMAGPAGLAQQYSQSYNSALAANSQNYQNILGGYQTVMNNVGNTLGQGGTPWGVAAPAAQAIGDVYAQQSGGAMQNSINRGVGNTTAATAAQRGASLDASKAYAGLGSQLASTYAGYEANLGQAQLNFMNGVQIPYPNGQEYSSLYQSYGAQQQAAASAAQQMALSQQQMRMAAGRGGSGGGGGVSVPAAPRGGTYGSGSSGFPSGGGVAPTNYGGPSTGQSGAIGIGGQSINPYSTATNAGSAAGGAIGAGIGMGGFDPWAENTGTASGDPTGFDPSGVTGNFGNTGYYLGSGVG